MSEALYPSWVIPETLAFAALLAVAVGYGVDWDRANAAREPLTKNKEKYRDIRFVSAWDRVMPEYAHYQRADKYNERVGLKRQTRVHYNQALEDHHNLPIIDAARGDGSRYELHNPQLRQRALNRYRQARGTGTLSEMMHRAAIGSAERAR